ncbi:MAG: KamA family radical SAM protein [Clostridia bacterium]|nr:KamA family radical SAM protein [Clostridia bacterium]
MNWQNELKNSITTVEQLCQYVDLSEEEKKNISELMLRFPMSITRHYMNLIDWKAPNDPLRKIVVPCATEFNVEGLLDTSGEAENTKIQGLQHKYKPTALMLSTNACASYCRFCFRKRMVGLTQDEIVKRVDDVARYLSEHPEIDNVLVSGGDALMNNNNLIRHILNHLTSIDSIQYVRFGSRMLSVLPQRLMDPELLEIFNEFSQKKGLYIVTHFEHPREITPDAIEAIDLLKRQGGVALKNQTVLLRGVNDSPTVLAELMTKLTVCGISPYYVFQCRPVSGVKKQFQVPLAEGYKIVDEAKKHMSGLAKQFRFGMSHATGKIEIIGMLEGEKMLFKYHEAKNLEDNARIFTADVSNGKAWLTEEDVK